MFKAVVQPEDLLTSCVLWEQQLLGQHLPAKCYGVLMQNGNTPMVLASVLCGWHQGARKLVAMSAITVTDHVASNLDK